MSNPNTDTRHLRGPVTVSLLGVMAAVAVVAVLAGLTVGAPEARAVVIGAAVVAVFFGLGLLVMSAALKFQPAAALPLALMTYVLQLAVVTLAFVAMDRAGVLGSSVDAIWLTVTVAALTVLFTAGLMWWGAHVRVPVFDLDAVAPSLAPGEGTQGPVRDASRGWEASAR